jgi:diaminopimelate decarboxylase
MNLSNETPLPISEHYPNIEQKRPTLLAALTRTGTPVFLCERENLIDRYQALTESLRAHWGEHVVGYSFKTNYLVAKCGIFRECGAWAEVVSGREYRLARKLDFPGSSIIFNGPHKTDDDLQTAIDEGALVNVNDHDELDRVIRIASAASSPIDIGLRLSSTLPKLGHSRFGFSLENGEATAALDRVRRSPQLTLAALHTHLYGDTDEANIYGLAASRLGEFAKQHIPDYQHTLKFIDMGGGFPAHGPKPKSRQTWNPQPIDVYIKAITDALRPFFTTASRQPTLIVEPGRYLTCDGIVLVTRVLHVKERDGKRTVNCDGSISMVPLTHYCPQIIRVYTRELKERVGEETPTIIHGSTCRENDILFDGLFPPTEPGDYLVHFAAGAYNSSLSPDFIFASPSQELF